jgi:hypothetical protein
MTGEMSGHAADHRPFDAPLGIRKGCSRKKPNRRQRVCRDHVHRLVPPTYIEVVLKLRSRSKVPTFPLSRSRR